MMAALPIIRRTLMHPLTVWPATAPQIDVDTGWASLSLMGLARRRTHRCVFLRRFTWDVVVEW